MFDPKIESVLASNFSTCNVSPEPKLTLKRYKSV
jgi:hypothetical protein